MTPYCINPTIYPWFSLGMLVIECFALFQILCRWWRIKTFKTSRILSDRNTWLDFGHPTYLQAYCRLHLEKRVPLAVLRIPASQGERAPAVGMGEPRLSPAEKATSQESWRSWTPVIKGSEESQPAHHCELEGVMSIQEWTNQLVERLSLGSFCLSVCLSVC